MSASGDLPEQFGPYRILNKRGASYLARDEARGRDVALEVVRFPADASAATVDRFYRDSVAASALTHPGLCPVYDAGQIGGVTFLATGVPEGRPLTDFIDPLRLLPAREAAALARQIALALADAHAAGVTHGRLTPSSVVVDAGGKPFVTGLGLAVLSEGVAAGPAADVFALGTILRELATGVPAAADAKLPPELEPILRRALAKKPTERCSMAEMAETLRSVVEADVPDALPFPEPPPAKKKKRPREDWVTSALADVPETPGREVTPLAEPAAGENLAASVPAWALGAVLVLVLLLFLLLGLKLFGDFFGGRTP